MRSNGLIFGIWLLLGSWYLVLSTSSVSAVYDPLSVPNNKYGVHILEPSEIFEAAKLVNSTGGDWGYLTIPIRTDDRDSVKWSNFMTHAAQNHLIPILRITTYADGDKWVAPPHSELTDFANFLTGLPWPTKNRYIIVYNEPNHSKEWGGIVAPSEYANLLIQASEIFKSRSADFFILSSGLDMSAPNNKTSMDALKYYSEMTKANKNWYLAIDGLSVHAYPNPGFTASVYSTGRFGITSYRFEISRLKSLNYASKPVFITETGYLGNKPFWTQAFQNVWTDPQIVAVTPFTLFAGAGDFTKFSLLDPNHQPTPVFKEIQSLKKTAGSPLLNLIPIASPTGISFSSGKAPGQSQVGLLQKIINFFFPPKPQLRIGQDTVYVEISDTPAKRTQGLSGRSGLPKNTGMLFVFENSQVQTFWMKDMKFSLDFIWINQGKVVNLHKNIPPPIKTGFIPAVISSQVPIDKILEVPAGFIDARKINIGDEISL